MSTEHLEQHGPTAADLPYDTDPDMRFTAWMSRDAQDEPTWTLTDERREFPDYRHSTLEACDHVVGYWLELVRTGHRIGEGPTA